MSISPAIHSSAALLVAALLGAGAPLAAQQSTLKSPGQPIVLATQGNFFVGGRYFTASGLQYMSHQMYVEYQIPQKVKHKYPVVLIHGGGLTGSYMSSTSDGREGWNSFFLRKGYAVYVVDQPARGRSAYHADVNGPVTRGDAVRLQQLFTATASYNLWPQARLHTQWPGSGLIGDATFDQFFASEVQGVGALTAEELSRAAGIALLDRIGPAILLTHSQSGPYGWQIADARPRLVKAIVAVEPNGPPFYEMNFVGAPDYFMYGALGRAWGITRIPITMDPPATDPGQLSPVLQAAPDGPGLIRCYLQANPARRLPNLARIPIAIVTGEASFRATYDHCTSKYLTQAGVANDHIRLGEVGIHGNGHMMMIEKNNNEVAAFIARWLEENVEKGGRGAKH
jgi:pimeloyl-ACP methyl ester carboxylesterase